MSTLIVPSLGESVTEATIAKWTKTDGASVGASDVVVELETDKATVELPAPNAGVLKTLKNKGDTVKVGEVIAMIEAGAAAASAPAAAAKETPAVTGSSKINPAAAALIAEHKLDAAKIPATGPKGNLTKEDVLAYVSARSGPAQAMDSAIAAHARDARAQAPTATAAATPGTTAVMIPGGGAAPKPAPAAPKPAPAPAAAPALPRADGPEETRKPLSKLRETIAKRLVEAQHATASLTTFNEIDMTAVLALREKYKESFEKTHGIGLGFMSFFAKAVCYALKAVPEVNAQIAGNEIIYKHNVHLGIAVSTDRGLMVPVVRYANKLSMAQIESEIKRLATKARDGKITVDELGGGTFTITNGGVFGSLLSTPILNPPQSGILGMHKTEKRAVVVTEGGKETLAIRPMMYVALTYDHRIIDGRQSVTFLVKVKEALEDPTRLLLEV